MSTTLYDRHAGEPRLTCVLSLKCARRCPNCPVGLTDLHEISNGIPHSAPEAWAAFINATGLPVTLEQYPADSYGADNELRLRTLIRPGVDVTFGTCQPPCSVPVPHSGRIGGASQNWEHPEVKCENQVILFGPDMKQYPCYRMMGLERHRGCVSCVDHCGQFGFCAPMDDALPGTVTESEAVRRDPFTLNDIAIILTGHPRVQLFLRESLASLRGWPGPIIYSYDDVDDSAIPWNTFDVKPTHVVCGGFPNMRLGWAQGMLWLSKLGVAKAQELGCPLIFKAEADETFYRWRNLQKWCDIRAEKHATYIGAKGSDWVFMRTNQAAELYDWITLEPSHNVTIAEPWFGRQRIAFGYGEIPVMPGDRIMDIGSFHIHYEYATNIGVDTREIWKVGELWPRKP